MKKFSLNESKKFIYAYRYMKTMARLKVQKLEFELSNPSIKFMGQLLRAYVNKEVLYDTINPIQTFIYKYIRFYITRSHVGSTAC